MTVSLRKGAYPLAVEVHAPFTWPDSVTKVPTSYLAGFRDPGAREKARRRAESKGWKVVGE